MRDLGRVEGENEFQYIWRLCQLKDEGLLDLNWKELAEVFNKNLKDSKDEYIDESAYRKGYQYAKMYYDFVFKEKSFDKEYIDEIDKKIDELKKERYKLIDERSEYNRKVRNQARFEDRVDKLENMVKEIAKERYQVQAGKHTKSSNNDMLIILSDLHIGQTFTNNFGRYDTDVAKERLSKYLSEAIVIKERHNSENCYVSLQGDLISNSIHKSIQVTNRENVIEQIKIVSQLITDFVYELSKYFNNVYIYSVSGNHSRIDRKEDAMKDERLDDLPLWYLKASLNHIKNIHVEDNNIDNSISDFQIRGKRYIGVHGDYDDFTKQGLVNLTILLGYIPDVILYGHKHFPAYSNIGNTQLIQCGSLAGSGDDHTLQKRLSGKASQTILICEDSGLIVHYPIIFE